MPNQDNTQQLLFVLSTAPHANLQHKEALDFALAAAAFGQEVSLLFTGDGIFQLFKNQNTEEIQHKNHCAAIDALALYGIDNVFVNQASIDSKHLSYEDLNACAKPLNTPACEALFQRHQSIFHY